MLLFTDARIKDVPTKLLHMGSNLSALIHSLEQRSSVSFIMAAITLVTVLQSSVPMSPVPFSQVLHLSVMLISGIEEQNLLGSV